MNKQIEELKQDLENHTCMSAFQAEIASKMLYAKGYRKASDVAEEIFAYLGNNIDGMLKALREERVKEGVVGTPLAEFLRGRSDGYVEIKLKLAWLKKKYIGVENDG